MGVALRSPFIKGLIGVVGSGLEDPELNGLAEEVGRLIACERMVLVNGGLGGVMQASSRGAKASGGTTVGILPGLDPDEANSYIDIPIATGLGEMRNLLVVRAAAALIAIGGNYGTLSEIALALKLKKPVVGLKSWDISPEIIVATDPAMAVALATTAVRSAQGLRPAPGDA
jgi:uncharacterized protein (TIGR00725 family)